MFKEKENVRIEENKSRTKIFSHKDFDWKTLIEHIKLKSVIPVIGQGLHRVEVKGKSERFLYDYLTELLLKECNATLRSNESHRFAKACLIFRQKFRTNYTDLSGFLKKALEDVRLVKSSTLWKLARIKGFKIFINTAYDDLLSWTLKTVRNQTPRTLSYSPQQKTFHLLDNTLLQSIDNNNLDHSLVYHIFGTLNIVKPAYTEGDILETVVQFQKDLELSNQNPLFDRIKDCSLLFLGCGFDDWLYRFFIRAIFNEPIGFSIYNQTNSFVADNFLYSRRDPFAELHTFLESYKGEVFHAPGGNDFVDNLFSKIAKDHHEEIITPGKVFVSFDGRDRKAASNLVANLRKDDIKVWFDEDNLRGGDNNDEKIFSAIEKCPAFIALVSQDSQKIEGSQHDKNDLPYYQKEWIFADGERKVRGKPIVIPVIIDKKDIKFSPFKDIYHYNIPDGKKCPDYQRLIKQLREPEIEGFE